MTAKTITIADFLTDEEITTAGNLYKKLRAEGKEHQFASTFDAEVLTPNKARVERALGQECDMRYLAYAVLHVMTQACDK